MRRNNSLTASLDSSARVTWWLPARPLQPPESPLRVYRDRLTAVMIRCWATLAVFLLLATAVAPPFPVAERIVALTVALIAGWIGYRFGRMCVAITIRGVWLGNGLFARWIPWGDVDRFMAVPWGFHSEIRVQTRGHPKAYRAPLVQGRHMRCDGQSTTDVLTALNAHLAAAREGKLVASPPAAVDHT